MQRLVTQEVNLQLMVNQTSPEVTKPRLGADAVLRRSPGANEILKIPGTGQVRPVDNGSEA